MAKEEEPQLKDKSGGIPDQNLLPGLIEEEKKQEADHDAELFEQLQEKKMITVNLMSKMKQNQQAIESLKSSSVFNKIGRALASAVDSESQLQIELVNGSDLNAAEIYTEIRCPEGQV